MQHCMLTPVSKHAPANAWQIITSIYYILSFITTNNLVKSYKLLDATTISNQIWRAPVAAAVLGGLLVLLFNLLSCGILLR